jgi:sterol 3beta-glucosyltransferase
MKLTLLTYGTHGDVQPFVALGVGLKRAGHAVRLAAPETYAGFAAQQGLEFAPLPGDPAQLSQALADVAGTHPLRAFTVVRQFALPVAAGVFRNARAACADADVVLYSFLLAVAGHTLARDLGKPAFYVDLFPVFTPTAAFPGPMFPNLRAPGAINRFTHALFAQMFWLGNRLGYRLVRGLYPDLPARLHRPFVEAHSPTPILNAFSPHVVPPPADWGPHIHTTGYWFLETSHWEPPIELQRFLDDGPPPVCIGFGSMVTREAQMMSRISLAALAQSGQRGLLLGGWGGFGGGPLPRSVFKIDAAPHAWLFPRMAMVVHHGGAGTTAASLRAGVPTLITPFTADQPFWGRRVAELGVGPRPIPRKQLTAARLAAAITTAVADRDMPARAAALGEKIRAEDGVARAVEIIER